MAVSIKMFIGNSTVLKLEALRFEGSTTYIDDAVVEATLTDTDGNDVTGENWPVTLDYISNSNGEYSYILPATIEITENELYYMTVVATSGDNVAQWRKQVRALNRS